MVSELRCESLVLSSQVVVRGLQRLGTSVLKQPCLRRFPCRVLLYAVRWLAFFEVLRHPAYVGVLGLPVTSDGCLSLTMHQNGADALKGRCSFSVG